jgi:hypothetical protein
MASLQGNQIGSFGKILKDDSRASALGEPSLCVSACAAQADRSKPSKMLGIIHSEQYRWFADMHGILPTPCPAAPARGKLRPALILQEAFYVEDWSLVFPVGIQGQS